MSSGKWIPDLTATTPLDDAARHVLSLRLEAVRDYLRLALHEPEKDPEYVHQLRVGTRRAVAALDIFALCLPEKVYRKARKRLRRQRRAAGAARDWDVFLASLTEAPFKRTGRARPGFDFLIGYAVSQRVSAQSQLQDANDDFPFAFDRLVADTLHALRCSDTDSMETLLDLACPVLNERLRQLEKASAKDLDNYENLHQVRIAGKRLRYAMEVFADCYSPEFREQYYAAVEEMQDILGRANDSYVATRRLSGLRDHLKATQPDGWKRYKPGIEGLLRYHEGQSPEERRHFEQWWQRWLESGGEKAFAAVLRSGAPPAVVEG
ncbi:MAG TPA: CHAD domain-containing protein [Gemmataceae bacterium]|nr:CHAD domain-containing protein [Gemmataceae bacterium]